MRITQTQILAAVFAVILTISMVGPVAGAALADGTTADVQTGDKVSPVYVEQLRDPEQSVRAGTGQEWDGFRFEPVQ